MNDYERTTVTRREAVDDPVTSTSVRDYRSRPTGLMVMQRFAALIFGIIQVLIILRIVLLLLNAREGNDLVSWILNASQIFVGPFEGMLNTNALHAGGSVLDVAAVLALVGWTVLEAIILAAVGIFRREPTV